MLRLEEVPVSIVEEPPVLEHCRSTCDEFSVVECSFEHVELRTGENSEQHVSVAAQSAAPLAG